MTKNQDTVVPPKIPKDLLDYLKRTYPDESAKLSWGLDEIRHRAGQVSVVHHLEALFREQNENVLTESPSTRVPRPLSKNPKSRLQRSDPAVSD